MTGQRYSKGLKVGRKLGTNEQVFFPGHTLPGHETIGVPLCGPTKWFSITSPVRIPLLYSSLFERSIHDLPLTKSSTLSGRRGSALTCGPRMAASHANSATS